jgi:hypothetical protein
MALINQKPFRTIADQFRVSKTALIRHHDEYLPATLAEAKRAEDTAAALDVMAELRRCFERVNLLFDACDRWLRDAAEQTSTGFPPVATCPPHGARSWPPYSFPSPARPARPRSTYPPVPGPLIHALALPTDDAAYPPYRSFVDLGEAADQ